jgi:hypothetical protein
MTAWVRVTIEDAQHKRLHNIAGRRGVQPDHLVHELIEELLKADVPGRINPLLRAIDPAARRCLHCGKDLPKAATRRRKYCGARCRVAANRAAEA